MNTNTFDNSSSGGRQTSGDRNVWGRFSLSGIEADLAYFEARLELIGTPRTSNQKAQVETFRFLRQAMGDILNRLRRKEPMG